VALVEPAPAKEEQEEVMQLVQNSYKHSNHAMKEGPNVRFSAVRTNSSRQLRKTTDSISRSLKSTEDLLSNKLLPEDVRCCWSFSLENWPS
jgi:hypothetical protein